MNCDICNKSFNSLMNFKQHELSKKHLNKVNLIKMIPPCASKSGLSGEVINCFVCSVNFNKMLDFQNHIVSLEHANMVTKWHNKNAEEKTLVTSNGNHQFPEGAIVKHVDVASIKFPGIKCEVCKMNFSGFKPHEQHLQSANHKRKVANMQKIEDPNASYESGFYCKICDIHCTGQAPYIQHCEGNSHKKNETKLHLTNKHDESSPNARLWYCEICQKQCSGAIPFAQHKSSKGHTKNLERSEVALASLINADSYVVSQQSIIPVSEATNENPKENYSTEVLDVCIPKAVFSDATHIRQDDDAEFGTPANKKIKLNNSEAEDIVPLSADSNMEGEPFIYAK